MVTCNYMVYVIYTHGVVSAKLIDFKTNENVTEVAIAAASNY